MGTNDKGRLSKDDIDRMVREAEQYADEDKAAKERIDAKNGLESYCYQMKNTLARTSSSPLCPRRRLRLSTTRSRRSCSGSRLLSTLRRTSSSPCRRTSRLCATL